MILSAVALLLCHSDGVAALVNPVGFSGFEPQVASTGNKLFVTCGAGDNLYVTVSTNGGSCFSLPVKLPTSGRLALGMRRGPRITATPAVIVVTALYGKDGGGKDGDILAWRSRDSGKTWQGPALVSDASGSASEGLDGLASSPKGRIACVWLDHRSESSEVWASTSADGGESWSKNSRVYRSPDGHVCECCHPSVAFGPKGELMVMFRNWLAGSRDMYLSSSTDGRTFSPARKLGEGTWPLNACPMDGGSLAVQSDGTVDTAWRRADSVFVGRPGGAEMVVGQGTQPWLALNGSQRYVVWQSQGQIMGEAVPGVVTTLGKGRNPVVANVNGRFLAVWADDAGRVWARSATHP